MDKRTNLIRKLKEFKKKVGRDIPIEKMLLFGSRATNKAKKESDVDLIIVSPKFKKLNFFQRGAKMYDYWTLNYPVDFLCYSNDEFEKLRGKQTIVRDAIENGVEI